MPSASAEDQQAQRDECVRQALIAGGKGGAWGFLGGAVSVGTLNQFSAGFRRSLGISGKTALVVSHKPQARLCWASSRALLSQVENSEAPEGAELLISVIASVVLSLLWRVIVSRLVWV